MWKQVVVVCPSKQPETKDVSISELQKTPSPGTNIILKTDGYKFSHHKQMPISWMPQSMRPTSEKTAPPIVGKDSVIHYVKHSPSTSKEHTYMTLVTDVSSVTVLQELPVSEGVFGEWDKTVTAEDLQVRDDKVVTLKHMGKTIRFRNEDESKMRPGSKLMENPGSAYAGAYNVSYFTPRAYEAAFSTIGLKATDSSIVFFGLNYLMKKHLQGPQVTESNVNAAAEHVANYMANPTKKPPDIKNDYSLFPYGDWMAIATGCYDTPGTKSPDIKPGHLPISIEALPEGSLIMPNIPCFKITNTHPRFYWLPNYLETLVAQVWYPITVATQSREIRRQLMAYSIISHRRTFMGNPITEKMCTDENDEGAQELDTTMSFDLLDFGYRGVSSYETAGIGSLAYYTSGFQGSDTVAGVEFGRVFYNKSNTFQDRFDTAMATSIPAAEHSTVTSWVQVNHQTEVEAAQSELDSFVNFMRVYKDSFAVALVSDGFNVWNAIKKQWSNAAMVDLLKDRVCQSKVSIFRPDSGEGIEALPQYVKLLIQHVVPKIDEALKEGNSSAEKPDYERGDVTFQSVGAGGLRVLQGDGVRLDTLPLMLASVVANGLCVDTVHFGSGGGLLQKVDRDSLSCAFKCCAMHVPVKDEMGDDTFKTFEIGKKPISGGKTSFAGDPVVTMKPDNKYDCTAGEPEHQISNGEFKAPTQDGFRLKDQALKCVFYNGTMVEEEEATFTQIIKRAAVTHSHLEEAIQTGRDFLTPERKEAFQHFTSDAALAARNEEADFGVTHTQEDGSIRGVLELPKDERKRRTKTVIKLLSAIPFDKKDFLRAWNVTSKTRADFSVLGV